MSRRCLRTTTSIGNLGCSFGLLLSCLSLSVGCGGGDGATAVTGVVTIKGTPVTTGVIGFIKSGTPAIGGPLGPDGSYSLSIPPGDYQVRVDSPSPMPEGWKEGDPLPQLPPRPVPESFAHFNSSGLTATITDESPQKLDFQLQ